MIHYSNGDGIRSKIRNGDVFAFQGTHLFSRIIQARTRSKYSHVGVSIWCMIGDRQRLCIMEALEGHGVRLFPMSRYLAECERENSPVEWWPIVDPAIDRGKMVDYVLGHWGNHYVSPAQFAVSFGITGWVRRLFGCKPVDVDPQRDFCSELVTAALEAGGYGRGGFPWATSPAELLGYDCFDQGEKERLLLGVA